MRAVETGITPLIPTCPDCEPEIHVIPFYPTVLTYNGISFIYNKVILAYNDTEGASSKAISTNVTRIKPACPCKKKEVKETPVENIVPPSVEIPVELPVENVGSTEDGAELKAVISSALRVLPTAPGRECPTPGTGGVPEISPEDCYMGINDFLAIAHAAKHKAISVWDFAKIAEYLFGNFFLSLDVFCEHGSTMLAKDASADLQAVLKLGYEDVTDRIAPQYFSWERSSKNENQDRLWNLRHVGVGSRIHVTRRDVNKACTFYCLIPITSLTTINQ